MMKVGDRVKVVARITGHEFNIGEVVSRHESMHDYVSEDQRGFINGYGEVWYMNSAEYELITSTKKIAPNQYTAFVQQFYTDTDWKHLRFGQAFMIHFDMLGQDKTLFYTEDLDQAVEIIFDNYVELENRK